MMLLIQGPVPPTPPSPQFDPNLIFVQHGDQPGLLFVILMLTAAIIILWPITRAFGRWLENKGRVDPALRADVEHLHAQLGEVDALQARITELEERVDFTERLLAQSREPDRLQG